MMSSTGRFPQVEMMTIFKQKALFLFLGLMTVMTSCFGMVQALSK